MKDTVDEQHLIGRILEGEPELFAELLGADERHLKAHVARLLRSPSEAEEVVQDALFKAFCHLRQFRRDASFRTWLFRIVINEARMRMRSRRREISLDGLTKESGPALKAKASRPSLSLDHLVAAEARTHLHQAVTRLPVMYQQVLRLRFIEEHSLDETAQRLALTKSATKTRQYRACEMLRRQLGPRAAMSIRSGLERAAS